MVKHKYSKWRGATLISIMSAMFAPPSQVSVTLCRLATLVLVLWLAGVGCIIGCEMNVAAAPKDESQSTSESESCPAFSDHDCCQKTGGSDGAATIGLLPQNTTNDSCCPLTGLSADPARKVSGSDAPLAVTGSGLSVTPDTRISTLLRAYRPKVPDRGSTHLRCCVFLI